MALIAACVAHDRRDAVQPAPPGPFDLIRSLWGDHSGRCPAEYEFCGDGSRSLCCPFERGCCEDSRGAHCCTSRERAVDERDEYEERAVGCSSDDITCSHEGRTVCCARSDSCCAGNDGPYCCSLEPRDPDRGGY